MKLALIFVLLSGVSAAAGFDASLEYLYLKPYVDDHAYALESTNGIVHLEENTIDGNCEYAFVALNWDSGFRASVQAPDLFCGINLGSSYTRYKTADSSSKTVSAPRELFVTQGLEMANITHAASDWDFKYQFFDAMLSYNFCCEKWHRFRPQVGLAILEIKQGIKTRYDASTTGNFAILGRDSTFRALGLKGGVDYSYGIADDLEIYAGAAVCLVAGSDRAVRAEGLNGQEGLKFKADDTLFATGWHLCFGFLYHESLHGFDIGLKLGYEMMAWHGLRGTASPLGLQGITAGLQVRF